MTTGQPMREPTFHVLAAMLDRPLHGYGIIRRAHELTDGRVLIRTSSFELTYSRSDINLASSSGSSAGHAGSGCTFRTPHLIWGGASRRWHPSPGRTQRATSCPSLASTALPAVR